MRIFARFWLLAPIALCLLPTTATTREPKSAIVITHATIINPGTSSVRANQTVVITGDHITSISGTEQFQAPKNARVIDATGQYLIPGLWDMHVHSAFGDWFPGGRDIILPLFIANGVIGVRDMGGDTPILLEWRKEIADGRIIGPRMVISGPMLDGYLPDGKLRFPSSVAITTPASAIAAVDLLKTQGVDFIKVQSVISHDAYLAAAREAHRKGLPIVGHVPDKVRIEEVVEVGQKSIEHLMGIFEAKMRLPHQTSFSEPDLAGTNARMATWRNISRPARSKAPASRQICSSVLARRNLAPLHRRDDARSLA